MKDQGTWKTKETHYLGGNKETDVDSGLTGENPISKWNPERRPYEVPRGGLPQLRKPEEYIGLNLHPEGWPWNICRDDTKI